MINTLPTWKSQHAANTLSHNDVVRLLGDANEEVARLKAQNAIDSEAASSLFCVIADISLTVGIPDSAPNICRETVKAVKQLTEERDALRSALQFIANHEAPEGSALETVVRFAKLAIEVKE